MLCDIFYLLLAEALFELVGLHLLLENLAGWFELRSLQARGVLCYTGFKVIKNGF